MQCFRLWLTFILALNSSSTIELTQSQVITGSYNEFLHQAVGHNFVFCDGRTSTFATLSLSIDTVCPLRRWKTITQCCCHCQYPNLLLVRDYHQRERERESGKPVLSQTDLKSVGSLSLSPAPLYTSLLYLHK